MQEDTTAIKAKGVVKSVQRGVLDEIMIQNAGQIYSIPISAVEPSKSLLFFSADANDASAEEFSKLSLTSTAITLSKNVGNSRYVTYYGVSWQVIEFY